MSYRDSKKSSYVDVNECTSRGACSIAPSISALQEVAMVLLQQISYYVLLLENNGASNESINKNIMTVLASLISVNEFSENQLFSIVQKEYYLLKNTVDNYHKLCEQKDLPVKDLKNSINFDQNSTLSQAISLGEKLILEKYNTISTEMKNIIAILDIVLKSVSLNLLKIFDFKECDKDTAQVVIETLNLFNGHKLSQDLLIERIAELANLDSELQQKISDFVLSDFGGISQVEVSHSTRKGKAILVSGSNFFDLLTLLEKTKDKDIDIYTHSNLIITHALKKFKDYENLRGHYGGLNENNLLDFATFPGAILLTKNLKNNGEYYYRGRLFTTDYIVPNGIVQIENDDYSKLINAACEAKGFSKGKIKEETVLGFDEEEISEIFDDIAQKLDDKSISHLYIIGIDAHSQLQKEYFKQFFKTLKNDEFVISFSYSSSRENVLTLPVGNYIPFVIRLLNILFSKISIQDERLTFFITTCDVMNISNIINLKTKGAKDVKLTECHPFIINPSIMDTFAKLYDVTLISY